MRPIPAITRHLGWSAALLALSGAATAQDAARLTLAEAIDLGLLRNPELQASRADRAAAGAQERQMEAQRWPRLFAEAGWRQTNNQVLVFSDKLTSATFAAADFAIDSLNHPDSEGHASGAVGLEIPVYTSGRLSSEIASARAAGAGAAAGLRAAEADLVLQITEAYYGVVLAHAAIGVAESAVENARRHEESAAARVATGAALSSDLLRARVERLARERDLERREGDHSVARARLRRVLGLLPGDEVEPVTPLLDPTEPLGDRGQYFDSAVASRPEIEGALRQAEAAGAAERAVRSRLGPEIAGLARYERNTNDWGSGTGSYVVGLALRWSALDRGRDSGIDAAAARAVAADARRRSIADGIAVEVESAYRDAQVADRSLALAGEAVEAATEARRINAERYAAGLLLLTDLLDAEKALVDASFAQLGARYEAVVGRTRLRRAAGLLEAPATQEPGPSAAAGPAAPVAALGEVSR